MAAPRLNVMDFASAFTRESSSEPTVTFPLALTEAAVPPDVLPVDGPIHEFTLLSSSANSFVRAPAPRRLMLRLRLVAVAVLSACACTSSAPEVTFAPSST